MSGVECGGDPPCWAHLVDDERVDGERIDDESTPDGRPLVVDLTAPLGSGGAIWSLPHGGDLDANLVRLDPDAGIGRHVNNDVDVMVIVQSGTGVLTVDAQTQRLGVDQLALIPRGSSRSIVAGAAGISYLSIHRRRSPLRITARPDPVDRE